jgi:Fe2+ transport system protein FeoA
MVSPSADSPTFVPLFGQPAGQRFAVRHIDGGRTLKRRLLALGIRSGVVVTVLQQRGHGLVVDCMGTRIALGEGVARKLLVVPDPISRGDSA